MEEKYYYHKFDLGKRKVILCARSHEDDVISIPAIAIGMSVCLPMDNYDEERGFNIARAGAGKRAKLELCAWIGEFDKHIINGILLGVEKSMRRKPGKYIAGYKKKKHTNITNDIVQK